MLRRLIQKSGYLTLIEKIHLSIMFSIVTLFILSNSIVLLFGQSEQNEWLIYQISSIGLIITSVMILNPASRIKRIFFNLFLVLTTILFIAHVSVLTFINHTCSYRYLILIAITLIPVIPYYRQCRNIYRSLNVLIVNAFMIFCVSSYFFGEIDSFSTTEFLFIVTLTIGLYYFLKNKTFKVTSVVMLPAACIILVFCIYSFTQQQINTHHYAFYVGPAYELNLGKSILSNVPSQYGYLSIHFVETILKPIGIDIFNFHILNLTLFRLYYLGFFILLIKITKKPILSIFLTLVVTLFQTYFSKYTEVCSLNRI